MTHAAHGIDSAVGGCRLRRSEPFGMTSLAYDAQPCVVLYCGKPSSATTCFGSPNCGRAHG